MYTLCTSEWTLTHRSPGHVHLKLSPDLKSILKDHYTCLKESHEPKDKHAATCQNQGKNDLFLDFLHANNF